ncbi:MAG: diguanylate cyclase [Clostridiales bacterium]|nr:diguanylate cyclase [Clostridiales bacterium]
MTYKDDLEKLRKEAGIDINDPAGYAPRAPARNGAGDNRAPSSSPDADGNFSDSTSGPFTSEEKKMSLWKKISLPFIRNSFLSVLFFVLITLIWIAVSHTVVGTLHSLNRRTLVIFMIKDAIFMIVLATFMYRLFCTQFANTYHLEQDSKKARKEVKEWQAIQQSMMETLPDTLVYTLDRDLRYTSFNNSHKYSMLRIWHAEIRIGEHLLDYIKDEELREKIRTLLGNTLNGEYASNIEQYGDNPLTAMYWQTYYAPILDDNKKVIGVSCFVINITSLKQSQSKNLFLSYHDPLTGLYNRVYCEELFEQAERDQIEPYSIIVASIAGMRLINDNYGRQTGDNLLIKVSELLSKSIKDNGTIARWGGDEFIVLLPNVDAATAEALTNICKCEFPGVTVNGVPLRAHIGYATRSGNSQSIQEVLRAAEHQSAQSHL